MNRSVHVSDRFSINFIVLLLHGLRKSAVFENSCTHPCYYFLLCYKLFMKLQSISRLSSSVITIKFSRYYQIITLGLIPNVSSVALSLHFHVSDVFVFFVNGILHPCWRFYALLHQSPCRHPDSTYGPSTPDFVYLSCQLCIAPMQFHACLFPLCIITLADA